MPDGHGLAIDWVGGFMTDLIGREMGDDLMAEEIEIDPFVAGAAFRAAEQVAVKAARLGKTTYRKGEMETRALGHVRIIALSVSPRQRVTLFLTFGPCALDRLE